MSWPKINIFKSTCSLPLFFLLGRNSHQHQQNKRDKYNVLKSIRPNLAIISPKKTPKLTKAAKSQNLIFPNVIRQKDYYSYIFQ